MRPRFFGRLKAGHLDVDMSDAGAVWMLTQPLHNGRFEFGGLQLCPDDGIDHLGPATRDLSLRFNPEGIAICAVTGPPRLIEERQTSPLPASCPHRISKPSPMWDGARLRCLPTWDAKPDR